MASRRVLITGSSGFMGEHLTSHLMTAGWFVIGLDRRPPRRVDPHCFRQVDLLDPLGVLSTVRAVNPDAIVHLAARTDLEGRTVADYPENSIGVDNLTSAIRLVPSVRRSLFVSSQLVCRAGYKPCSDEDYCPPNAYGESKVRTEQRVRASDGGGGSWCILRPTTVWGPGMNSHYLRFFRHLRAGRYFHPGAGRLLKSYGYVGNIVHQLKQFLVADDSLIHRRMFYVADYEPISLADWIDSVAVQLGSRRPFTLPLPLCRALAMVGDLFQTAGVERLLPFNSFRLDNILAEYTYDLSATEAVCGALPYDKTAGVRELVDWIIASSTGGP